MKYTYLLINAGSMIVPFLFSFHPKLKFFAQWRAFWPACAITAAAFIIWDMVFTRLGVWGFNPDYITGFYIGNLPVEEVLFFICIPYACVFTYHCLSLLIRTDFLRKYSVHISAALMLILTTTVLLYSDRQYTAATSALLGAMICTLYVFRFTHFLGRFFLIYLVILIPFFIVNGILTGTGLEEPVVWYNDSENLGVRMLTIPVEDTFYGMLMVLMNVALFERFKAARAHAA